MSAIGISLLGEGRCAITHADQGARIESSKTPEFGGVGGAFSSTDLLAAALGSCIATNLEPVAERHDLPLDQISLTVDKALSVSPKRIKSLAVEVRIGTSVSPSVLTRLERAASHCLVHQSLSTEVDVTIRFVTE